VDRIYDGEMGKREKWETSVIMAIRKEINRSKESRYDHRLHALLLVAQGMRCSVAARYLGDAPRTVQCWIRLYEKQGFKGMEESVRTGRPGRISSPDRELIAEAVKKLPEELGLSSRRWNGKALADFLQKQLHLSLSIRQCQRLLRSFENRSRKR
jgi:transposase